MPFAINIFNIQVNGISKNGNVDVGTNIQNSHTANSKSVGACFALGNFSIANSFAVNTYIDPDVSDQDQIANPSAPVATTV
jgi:hypothetical protein